MESLSLSDLSSPPEKDKTQEALEYLWENVMPWMLHPGQKQALDVGLDMLGRSLGHPELFDVWTDLSTRL